MAQPLHRHTTMRFLLLAALAPIATGCSSNQEPEIAEVTVLAHLAPCETFQVLDCMVVDEGSGPAYFYGDIRDFTYHWGSTYRLEVDIVHIAHPVPDASSRELHLREILDVQPAAPRSEFTVALHGEADASVPTLLTPVGQDFAMPFGREIVCEGPGVCAAIRDALARPATFDLTLRHPDDPSDELAPLTAVAVTAR